MRFFSYFGVLMISDYNNLTYIASHEDLALYELIPSVVWIFDLDNHGWWWGNDAALKFWGLNTLEELINKDLSGDTQGARDRTAQTFELAAKNGLTIDPWTTYPNGKPKTLHMMHRSVLIGPDRHRAIIAYINEEVNLGETPENLLLVEAMRYTTVLVTSFTYEGDIVIENPTATDAYKHIDTHNLTEGQTAFSARFDDVTEGENRLKEAIAQKGGRWTHWMQTSEGRHKHTLDIRITRHPLTGDFLVLMTEYDVTALSEALAEAEQAQESLRKMAHFDAVTDVPSLHYLLSISQNYLARADRAKQKIAVMFMDLDGFKSVNDTWGHSVGDQILKSVAQRVTHSLREADQLARIGGDEFIILIDDIAVKENVQTVAHKLLEVISQPIEFMTSEKETSTANISASIGIAFFPEHGNDIESLIKIADSAMYKVKKRGKCGFLLAN